MRSPKLLCADPVCQVKTIGAKNPRGVQGYVAVYPFL